MRQLKNALTIASDVPVTGSDQYHFVVRRGTPTGDTIAGHTRVLVGREKPGNAKKQPVTSQTETQTIGYSVSLVRFVNNP